MTSCTEPLFTNLKQTRVMNYFLLELYKIIPQVFIRNKFNKNKPLNIRFAHLLRLKYFIKFLRNSYHYFTLLSLIAFSSEIKKKKRERINNNNNTNANAVSLYHFAYLRANVLHSKLAHCGAGTDKLLHRADVHTVPWH